MKARIVVFLLLAIATLSLAQPPASQSEIALLRAEVKRLSNQVDLLTQIITKGMAPKEASPMLPANITAPAPAFARESGSQLPPQPQSTTRVMPGAIAP